VLYNLLVVLLNTKFIKKTFKVKNSLVKVTTP
jgi:hypothetical protein